MKEVHDVDARGVERPSPCLLVCERNTRPDVVRSRTGDLEAVALRLRPGAPGLHEDAVEAAALRARRERRVSATLAPQHRSASLEAGRTGRKERVRNALMPLRD